MREIGFDTQPMHVVKIAIKEKPEQNLIGTPFFPNVDFIEVARFEEIDAILETISKQIDLIVVSIDKDYFDKNKTLYGINLFELAQKNELLICLSNEIAETIKALTDEEKRYIKNLSPFSAAIFNAGGRDKLKKKNIQNILPIKLLSDILKANKNREEPKYKIIYPHFLISTMNRYNNAIIILTLSENYSKVQKALLPFLTLCKQSS